MGVPIFTCLYGSHSPRNITARNGSRDVQTQPPPSHSGMKESVEKNDESFVRRNNMNDIFSRRRSHPMRNYRQKFVVDHTIEDAPVCDAASKVAASMVSELRVHTIANVVELFVQKLVVLQTSQILDSGLVMRQHQPLRLCG
ncbi:hypothetical protein TNCV_499781 [Trichonephila clavipes]|nr:hypothetical protein TNCV_499781 [Trichonephila clavipes]